ncbi:MAG: nucleotidyl transferase AbiEii/AbiGii toxin family protein [Sphaerochaetaceae bacterium]
MLLCSLSRQDKLDIFNEAETQKHIIGQAIEKDWWVCVILKVLFSSQYSDNIVFKGGTSLSKGWHLIERFSEDIDIAIQRELLGYGGNLSKTQISDKLRRASCTFVRTELKNAVSEGLLALGVSKTQFNIFVEKTSVTTVDPEKIYIEYESVYEGFTNEYIRPRVIIEAGARSIYEPALFKTIKSFVTEIFPDQPFSDTSTLVKITPAERTFLEKAFLLHEEFHKPENQIRSDRMSRHLYDLERMMDTPISNAIGNTMLYDEILEHRRKFTGLAGFDYETLRYNSIDFIPPKSIANAWKKDYQAMRESLIYGNSLPYEALIARIQELNRTFRSYSMPITSK